MPSAETAGDLPLLRSYLDHLAVERGLSPNTLQAYRRDLERYLSWTRLSLHRPLAEVSEADLAGYLATLRAGSLPELPPLAAASAARALAAVRGLHAFAVKEGRLPGDPSHGLRAPKLPRRLPKAIAVAEVAQLIEAAAWPGTPLARRDALLLELLYGTGARVGEAVALDVDDIDADTRLVRLFGKGRKERVVPVGQAAIRALGDYLSAGRPRLAAAGPGGAALLLNARGRRLTRQGAWLVLRAAAQRAGLSVDLSPHTLRHTFATHLLDGGADVRVVQELLGHASVTTTQIYTLVTVDRLREVYAQSHPRALH